MRTVTFTIDQGVYVVHRDLYHGKVFIEYLTVQEVHIVKLDAYEVNVSYVLSNNERYKSQFVYPTKERALEAAVFSVNQTIQSLETSSINISNLIESHTALRDKILRTLEEVG